MMWWEQELGKRNYVGFRMPRKCFQTCFQIPLGEAVNSILDSDMLGAIKEDILEGLNQAGWTKE